MKHFKHEEIKWEMFVSSDVAVTSDTLHLNLWRILAKKRCVNSNEWSLLTSSEYSSYDDIDI